VIPGLFGDAASRAVRTALGGLTRRQETIAHNIANVDTPGFRAQEVRFEEQLRAALAGPTRRPEVTRLGLATTHQSHLPLEPRARAVDSPIQIGESLDGTLRNDGNTVDVDRQMTQLAETQVIYNALAQAQINRFAKLRSVIREGR
jgi:flagellar basal-body rod protein FlgB